MFQTKFYQNFTDFFQRGQISQSTDFEKVKKEWIPFLNITESIIQPCICGHNVKHLTYLLNVINKTVILIGTSCCKKYGFLEKHMENEILIHILREQISRLSYKNLGNIITFTKDLGILLEEYIFEKFSIISKKYSRDMDDSVYFFDVFFPINKMKEDVLELIQIYGYDFNKYYDEICEFLTEKEIHNKEMNDSEYYLSEDSISETNSEIFERLDKIEVEISQLLNEKIEEENNELEENIVEENNELQENLRIEEEIQKENLEKEGEIYLENEDKELKDIVYSYVENMIERKDKDMKIYSISDYNRMIRMDKANDRLAKLRNDIDDYKADFVKFRESLENLKEQVNNFNIHVQRKMDIKNSHNIIMGNNRS